MDIVDVLPRVVFLVAIAIVGLIAGKRLKINPRDISVLLIYVVSPAVIVVAVLDAPAGGNYLLFTLGAYLVCSALAGSAYIVGSMLWRDSRKNLFAFAGGTGNTGYFGLPMALGVFGDAGAAIAVFIIIGVNLYEFTFGYYLSSCGNASIRSSLCKIARLPTMYAFILALAVKQLSDVDSETLLSGLNNFKGAYSVLGMMVIGITLSKFKSYLFDTKFLVAALSWKFLAWPFSCFALIGLLGGSLSTIEQSVIMLMSATPMAGNIVVIANELDVHPEKAATAVMASTLLAIVTVPLSLAILQM